MCLDALLQRHAVDVNVAVRETSIRVSLLWNAVQMGDVDCLRVLARRRPVLQLAVRHESGSREFVFNDPYSLVMVAAERNHPEMIEWLFDQCGVDLFAQLAFDETLLAISCACVGRAPDCLSTLLAYGSPIGDNRALSREYQTTLSWAATVGNASCCALLIAAGAVVDDVILSDTRTPLDTRSVLRGENDTLVNEQRAKLDRVATRLWRRRIAEICIGLQSQMLSTLELDLIVEFALPFAFRVPAFKRFSVVATVRHWDVHTKHGGTHTQ